MKSVITVVFTVDDDQHDAPSVAEKYLVKHFERMIDRYEMFDVDYTVVDAEEIDD